MTLPLWIAVLWLAYANGANDNFKGVATVYGGGTLGFAGARRLATAATLLGGLAAVLLGAELAARFKGRDLVPAALMADPAFALSVAGAAATTVFLATRLAMPTSTTHALLGGLVGAVLAGHGSVDAGVVARGFLVPLLLSPLLAVGGAGLLFFALRRLRRRYGAPAETCVCVGEKASGETVPAMATLADAIRPAGAAAPPVPVALGLEVAPRGLCARAPERRAFGFSLAAPVDALHLSSAAAVCFARSLNDTPKIAALFMTTYAAGATMGLSLAAAITAVVLLGGWFGARGVARTMALEITDLGAGRGVAANLVTAGLVLGASRLGVPVSTTHVSCGAIFGIGATDGRLHWRTIGRIATTWVTTLPLAAVLGALAFHVLNRMA